MSEGHRESAPGQAVPDHEGSVLAAAYSVGKLLWSAGEAVGDIAIQVGETAAGAAAQVGDFATQVGDLAANTAVELAKAAGGLAYDLLLEDD